MVSPGGFGSLPAGRLLSAQSVRPTVLLVLAAPFMLFSSAGMARSSRGESPEAASHGLPESLRPRYATVAWVLLLVLGGFYLLAPLSDLVADARTGLPTDHLGAFQSIVGASWGNAQQSALRMTQYVTLLEIAYAVHELVFGILFVVVVAIPFRRGVRWAWWTCWAPMLANVTYSLTFGRADPTILARSLIADLALPVLLLVQIPVFWNRRSAGHQKHS